MAIGSPQWMYSSGEYELEQSLKFDNSGQHYLTRTPAANGNRRTWTMSYWVKYTSLLDHRTHFGGSLAGSDSIGVMAQFDGNTRQLMIVDYRAGYNIDWIVKSDGGFRDPSAWYHIVIAIDTTQATAANRVKLYANGVELGKTAYTPTYPSQNFETKFNQNNPQIIGGHFDNLVAGNFFDGYLTEMNFIDGQQLTPSDFGKTGTYGEWKPKEYSGTYGTNGFYLPFKQDYSVEGFSTTLYKGTGGTTTPYIGGVGFSPSLLWLKNREANNNGHHFLWDKVRGTGPSKALRTNVGNAEGMPNHSYDHLESFETDGFTIGRGTYNALYINSTQPYVAWSWEMGDSFGLPETITANGSIQHWTSQSKIGASSIYVSGGSDYLSIPDNDKFDFQGDFTVELFARRNGNQSANGTLISKYEVAGWTLSADSDNKVHWWDQATGTQTKMSSTVLSDATWHHIAVVRKNDGFLMFLDGTLVDSVATDYDYSTSSMNTPMLIGRYSAANSGSFVGHLDEIRISNKARYTSSFTPSTSAFTNDSNTIFLLHSDTSNGSTTFIDSSGATKNTNGSTTSYVSANPTYGQSIVSYTGTGSNATVGHGLTGAPEMMIVKDRDQNMHPFVYHTGLTNANYSLKLDNTQAEGNDSTKWNGTAPTSSVFSIGTEVGVNQSGNRYIAYCWDSVANYSKISSYTGNGSTQTITGVGFEPAWILIRRINADHDWVVLDNQRKQSGRTAPSTLRPNDDVNPSETNQDGDDISAFTSDGFTVGVNARVNGNGDTFIYMAFADTREYSYWLDQSGNNNDWTSNNLTESDISVDSPSNNFATWNPLHNGDTATFAEGNLKLTTGTSTTEGYYSTMAMPETGKWYAEFLVGYTGGWNMFGIASNVYNNSSSGFRQGTSYSYSLGQGNFWINGSSQGASSPSVSWTAGDVVSVAVDLDNNKWYIAKNNTWYQSANPSSGSNGITIVNDIYHFGYTFDHDGVAGNTTANFGQDSSFAGNKTAQGNQDGNEIGDFFYTPPTGFLALCTKNLPDVAVVPSKHFDVVTYTGTGSGQAVAVNFQPDFSWIKVRSITDSAVISDAVRGANKTLFTAFSDAEADNSAFVSAFTSTGLTLGGNRGTSQSGETYVAWNWKANGSGSSNTDGTITSTVSANVDAGFSIIEHSGNATANATIGHGLSKAPDLVISKKREDNGYIWSVFVKELGNQNHLRLDTTSAAGDEWEGHEATTASVIQLSAASNASFNAVGKKVITYAWHSVDGYSKVGSYTGNSNADGTFVYTGFRPMWIMTKATQRAEGWRIRDTKRDIDNPLNIHLEGDTSGAEQTSAGVDIDILSNGFKLRSSDSGVNHNGEKWIYIAFAETPFKYSNAR